MTTKELKLALITLASETVKDIRSTYVADNLDDAIYTTAGWVIFRKQNLKTDFCFSYDPVIKGDYDEAVKMVRNANTNPEYFIKENLKVYDELIEQLENNNMYFVSSYFEFPDAPFVDIINEREAKYFEENDEKYGDIKLGAFYEVDKKNILSLVKKLREKQEKRCRTYIKKYGMTNIKSWIYDRNN